MTNIIEHLKVAENDRRDGWDKTAKTWEPHGSFEKGTRTLAYGHKLSEDEEAGNFVTLPDGTIHDFDTDGGIAEETALALLNFDIVKHRKVAKKDWDKANKDKPFAALTTLQQDVLTEIAFNAGTLNFKKGKNKGKFQWIKLAKAIKANDIEEMKEQVSRKAITGEPLKLRNQQVKAFIANHEPIVQEGDIESGLKANIRAQLQARGERVDADLQPIANTSQNAPQGLSEDERSLSNELAALGGPEAEADVSGLTEAEEQELAALEKELKSLGVLGEEEPQEESTAFTQAEADELEALEAELSIKPLPLDKDVEIQTKLQNKLDPLLDLEDSIAREDARVAANGGSIL